MTAQEKAEELYRKYWDELYSETDVRNQAAINSTKQCTLIAVDEIKKSMLEIMPHPAFQQYWYEVKQEIEKL